MQPYDSAFDYRQYRVGPRDAPYLSCAQAAQRLGVETSQAVRSMVARGSLPALREERLYNPRYQIPEWAVDGYARLREPPGPPAPANAPHSGDSNRIRELEDALAAVRAAREHEQRALSLQIEASRELALANEVLQAAVTAVLIPPSIEGVASGQMAPVAPQESTATSTRQPGA